MTLMPYTAFDSQLDRLFEDAVRAVGKTSSTWSPRCNVYEDENGLYVEASLPGIDPKNVEILVENGELTIKGHRKDEQGENIEAESGRTYFLREMGRGDFFRSFTLPTDVDQTKVAASYKQGVLSLHLPKREEAKPRRIMIDVA